MTNPRAMSPSRRDARKLRILCLHGYRGSGEVLRSQLQPLAAGLEGLAEFVYVDAPSLAEGDFGWWHAVRSETSGRPGDPGVGHESKHYKGWAKTRDALVSIFERQGPFDGVFGFSQGAALTSLLVGLRAPDGRPTPERPLAFDFAMMVGGFASHDPAHAALYAAAGSYELPSLHIVGRSDFIVPSDDSLALAARFSNPLVLQHGGGHVIASEPPVREGVRGFLHDMLRRRAARQAAASGGPIEVPLWPGREGQALRVFLPRGGRAKPAPALVVFQGGAYATSAGSGGGSAEWAAAHGMVGVQVPYRTRSTNDAYPAAYDDAARAVRLVRHHAAAWGVDPGRVGVLGYSAGGHLASLLSTQPTLHVAPDDDLAARWSARPDVVVLGYPVISFVEHASPGALAGSAENFFGRRDLDDALRRQFSNELHVAPDHPPVFLWTTQDDPLVPFSHAERFADACRRANVPVSYRLFPHGPHGLGLALEQSSEVATWTTLLLAWLDARWGAGSRGGP